MDTQHTEQLVGSTAHLFLEYNSDINLIARALEKQGCSSTEAPMFVAFVQCAFGWALVKTMGVSKFPSEFEVESPSGKLFTIPVESQDVFTTALAVATNVVDTGYTGEIDKSVFMAVANSSAEVNAVSRALDHGEDMEGSEIKSSRIYGFVPEDFGIQSKPWWKFWA